MPHGFLKHADSCCFGLLVQRAIIPDPTIHLPPPSVEQPTWTVIQSSGASCFTGPAYGDGSCRSLCGLGTERAGYCVVQLETTSVRNEWKLCACLVGPLPYALQRTPAAELFALIMYVRHYEGEGPAIYHGDCQWVLDGVDYGEWYTTRGSAKCADLWKELWAAIDRRKIILRTVKVEAHQTESSAISKGTLMHKEGNGYADAGAKLGVTLHPTDADVVESACSAKALVAMTAKYLVAQQISSCEGPPDAPKLDRRGKKKAKEAAAKTAREAIQRPPRHMPVPTQPSGVRCLWCFRLAHTAGALNKEKCVQAANHSIYVAGSLFICKGCGSFSEKRTKLLYRHCRGITTKDAGNFRRRVFAEHVHPTRGTPLPKPVKWWTAPSPQTIEAMEHEQRSGPA